MNENIVNFLRGSFLLGRGVSSISSMWCLLPLTFPLAAGAVDLRAHKEEVAYVNWWAVGFALPPPLWRCFPKSFPGGLG